jgi:hypothetical protein
MSEGLSREWPRAFLHGNHVPERRFRLVLLRLPQGLLSSFCSDTSAVTERPRQPVKRNWADGPKPEVFEEMKARQADIAGSRNARPVARCTTMAHGDDGETAMTNEIEKLLRRLAKSNQEDGSRCNESRTIRRKLRGLGHRGGLRESRRELRRTLEAKFSPQSSRLP